MFNLLGGAIDGGAGGIGGDTSSAESSAGNGTWISGGGNNTEMLIKAGTIAGALVSIVALAKILKGK